MCDGTEFYQRVWVTSYHGVRLFDGSRRKHESYHGAKTFFQNLTTPCWHVTSHAVNFGPRTGLAVADTESWQMYNDVTDSSQLTHGIMSVRNKNKNTSNFYYPITSPYADLLYLLMRYQYVTYRIMCRCDVAHSLNLTAADTAKKRNTDSTCG